MIVTGIKIIGSESIKRKELTSLGLRYYSAGMNATDAKGSYELDIQLFDESKINYQSGYFSESFYFC